MDPFTIAAIAMAAGGAIGMLTQDDVSVPGLATEEDIARDMPDVYAQIQRNRKRIGEAERLLAERRSGPTAQERLQISEGQGNLAQQQGQMGLLGTSVGNAQRADLSNRLTAAIAERAMQEEMQRNQMLSQLEQEQSSLFGNARQGIGQQRGMQFQNDLAEQQARNQFYSGLMNAGIGMGANQYMNQQNLDANQRIAQMYYGQQPQQFNAQANYPMYQQPASMGYGRR